MGEWDDVTPPQRPAGREVLRQTAQEGERSRQRIDSLEEAVGQILGELAEHERRSTERLEALGRRVDAGFERMGELLDDLHQEHDRDTRRAEVSHHDLSEELARTRRIATMKSVSWPTAAVVIAVLVCYTVLLALHVEVPAWMGALIASLGTVLAGFAPALLGQGKAS